MKINEVLSKDDMVEYEVELQYPDATVYVTVPSTANENQILQAAIDELTRKTSIFQYRNI